MLSTIKLFHQAEPFPQQKIYIHKIYQTFESINKEEIIYIYKSAKLQRDSRIGREKKASHKSGSKSLFSWHVTYLRPYRKLLFLFLFFSLAFFLLLSKFSCLHFRPTTFLRHTHPYLPPSILPPENLPFQEAEKQKFRTFLCLFSFLHFFFPVNPVHGYKEFQSTGEKNLMSGSFWALKMEENQRLLRLFFPHCNPHITMRYPSRAAHMHLVSLGMQTAMCRDKPMLFACLSACHCPSPGQQRNHC